MKVRIHDFKFACRGFYVPFRAEVHNMTTAKRRLEEIEFHGSFRTVAFSPGLQILKVHCPAAGRGVLIFVASD
jgi:hypothetical protein